MATDRLFHPLHHGAGGAHPDFLRLHSPGRGEDAVRGRQAEGRFHLLCPPARGLHVLWHGGHGVHGPQDRVRFTERQVFHLLLHCRHTFVQSSHLHSEEQRRKECFAKTAQKAHPSIKGVAETPLEPDRKCECIQSQALKITKNSSYGTKRACFIFTEFSMLFA